MRRRHIKRKEGSRKTPLQWPIHSGYRGIICFEVPAYGPMIKPGLLRQVVVFRDEDVLPGDFLHVVGILARRGLGQQTSPTTAIDFCHELLVPRGHSPRSDLNKTHPTSARQLS